MSLHEKYSPKIHLIITGDGPYLDSMKIRLKDFPCTFTGYLEGIELASVYASSDIFVFPSTTDTFGNVVLEAQASGLPVVVSDEGGPCENVIPGKTGFVSANQHGAFCRHIEKLLDNPLKRGQMGRAARKYMEERSFGKAFLETWKQLERSTLDLAKTYTGMP
jgi:glycosyltransferase involved in cell wall biosynthesis